jgi:putative ABC transport system permease protein
LLATVQGVDGVATAEGSIQGFAQIVDADGNAGISDGLEVTIGSNWVTDPRLNPLDLADGRAPSGPSEVVLDKATADREGWTVGSTVTVLSKAAPREMTVVGIATYGSIDGLPGTTLVATDTRRPRFRPAGHLRQHRGCCGSGREPGRAGNAS